MKNIIKYIEKCSTWRDIYSLKETFLEHGLCITNTINGTGAICTIKNGQIQTEMIFDDYIFIEGKDAGLISERSMEILSEFIADKSSEQRLSPETVSYIKHSSFYGKSIGLVGDAATQQIQFISNLLGE